MEPGKLQHTQVYITQLKQVIMGPPHRFFDF